jgi:hypothetical protein
MKKEDLSAAMSEINIRFIDEAENYNMSKRKIIRRPLSRMAVAAIIISCIILIGGVAYAGTALTSWESIISFFDDKGNKVDVTVSDEAFFKELPEGLPVPGDGEPMIAMTRDEVESLLGFNILGSELSPENTVFNYDAHANHRDKAVAVIGLWVPNFIKESESKNINMSVSILSTKAEEGYILPFIEGKDAMGGKLHIETYKIESLDVNTVIYTTGDGEGLLKATFVHDDISYTISSYNYTLDELKDILNTLR